MKQRILEILKNLNQYWQELDEKKRRLASIIIGILLLVLAYFVLVFPIQTRMSSLQAKAIRYEHDYHTIASYSTAQKTNTNNVVADVATSLESAIDKVAKDYKIVVTKMTKSGKQAVSIEIEKIDSVDLFSFLEELEKKYAIYVEGLDVDAVDTKTIKVKRLMVGRG